ncbi:hypothetical protein BCR37DRAFT_390357 [Protomyces lactucae-debilis]|uniref:Uncharacterized protein n=1 Tax=Protomyces lactucae-debilis TaxID=2754530 RepID=A0A1Y2FV20_PROLT|nr:uncharacterized protein BCR37DRAFT_390357 [Protomyces lactucae-debilis]ORY87842.1 hypothetical protein BCR37DRAFT_390357 [Protomyces lactucae-debilis]
MAPPLDGSPDSVKGRTVKLPFNLLWESLVEKTTKPDRYLPVRDVTCRDNEDGSIYREMRLPGKDGSQGIVMKENIYHDEQTKTVEFRNVDDANFVVVNRYVDLGDGAGGYIEYFVKDSEGKMLGWMKGGRDGAGEAIEKHYRYAEEKEAAKKA